MKKLLSVLSITLLLTILPFGHVHDEKCGYDSKTETGCIYENGITPLEHKDPGK